ncbi:MAG: hypothetical protein JWP91_1358 [Fibrobacteres bacterium]|nr:hypothetical protein [Fibrobacterota bacterium]
MKATIAVLALAPMLSFGALCDDTYNLQSATQTLLTGTNPKNLAKTAKVLKGDFSDMTFIHDQLAYSLLYGFEGACAKSSKPVRFFEREGRTAALSRKTVNYQVAMYDSNTILQGSHFDYWFGFYKPSDSLQIALGRNKGGTDFKGWYGYVAFEDSVRNPESGLWTNKGIQLRMAGPADSAVLDSILMVRTGFRNLVFDQNRRGHFTLQYIRISLENKPGIAIRHRAYAAGPGAGDDPDHARYGWLVNGKRSGTENVPAFSGTRRYFREAINTR